MEKEIILTDNPPSDETVDFGSALIGFLNMGALANPILAVASVLANTIAQHNTEVLLKEILARLNRLEDEQRRNCIDNLTSENGQELVKCSLIKIKDCYQDAQILRIVDVVMAAANNNKISYLDADMLIDIISGLNKREAEFFVWLSRGIIEDYRSYNDKSHYFERFNWDGEKLERVSKNSEFRGVCPVLLNRLEAKGLVNYVMETITRPKIQHNQQVGNDIETRDHYYLTHFGRLYVKLINNMLESDEL